MAERLQKWLAGQGLGSRRHIETLIAAGRITVNGRTAELGQKVTGNERITFDGRVVRPVTEHDNNAHRVLLYHKPVGEICTRSDPEGRATVFDALPRIAGARWISVGRLDVQTSGLIVFTTDGDLAHRLMHPSTGLQREYAVRVQGEAKPSQIERLSKGVKLDDGPARFDRVEHTGGEGTNQWYRVALSEGRNRIVRRLWEAVGLRVSRLIRVRFGPLDLPRRLRPGRYEELSPKLKRALYTAAGLPPIAHQDSAR